MNKIRESSTIYFESRVIQYRIENCTFTLHDNNQEQFAHFFPNLWNGTIDCSDLSVRSQ
jgi:hypothetical protein